MKSRNSLKERMYMRPEISTRLSLTSVKAGARIPGAYVPLEQACPYMCSTNTLNHKIFRDGKCPRFRSHRGHSYSEFCEFVYDRLDREMRRASKVHIAACTSSRIMLSRTLSGDANEPQSSHRMSGSMATKASMPSTCRFASHGYYTS